MTRRTRDLSSILQHICHCTEVSPSLHRLQTPGVSHGRVLTCTLQQGLHQTGQDKRISSVPASKAVSTSEYKPSRFSGHYPQTLSAGMQARPCRTWQPACSCWKLPCTPASQVSTQSLEVKPVNRLIDPSINELINELINE